MLVARKEVGLEVNAKKEKHIYISVYRDQNAGQNDKVKIGNISFDNVTKINTGNETIYDNIYQEKVRADSIQKIHAKFRSSVVCVFL